MTKTRRRTLAIALTGVVLAAVVAIAYAVGGGEDRVALKAASDRYQIELYLGEQRTGPIDAELVVRDTGGRPAELSGITLAGVMPSMGHAMSELTATATAPGRYAVRGELFTMTGQWEVVVRLGGSHEITVPVTVTR
ncbi:hypothetical protein HPO96_21780 [Kribbella sandramycini]|uniref:YtkA-like domain-containing protein n=1 Tax=Kribbella sandramycini TaxID=60450 RepID=A0A7Y4L202_9ACTN|nr:FixH family protein [Kribbella sandramycini]MBB6566462.1 hypothetical protein [Kribbella sandramycini]NOL42880.1 hypothetical protein [Kribbella sandramycini]